MKKLTFLLLLVFLGIGAAFSQGMALSDKLPNDPKVVVGKLDNGLTYYIRQNSVPENRAELTLAVYAGSVLETEEQRGLAHFTEHMAFNGSTHFNKNELVNYMESIGMQFGSEVNAYTSFDETVYGIKVPTDNSEFIDKGLLVLYDWAHELTMDDDMINDERGVIHEEWRLSQGAQERVQNEMLKAVFNGSKYAERLPIGLMEVVDNFDPKVIKDFYKTWYRPDLMAVIVVGDFDVADMENRIKKQFSQIPKPVNPKTREVVSIPDHKETIVKLASDPECPATMVEIFYKHPQTSTVTVADARRDMVSSLMSQMLMARLSEIALSPNPPFVQAFGAYSPFMGGKDVFMNIAVLQNDKIENAVKVLVTENQRMLQHGFTQTELDRAKKDMLKMIEKQYNERDKQKSESYINEYKANFMPPHSAYLSAEYEHDLYNKYIPEITLEEVNNFAATMITDENCVVFAMAPEKEGFKLPTEAQIRKAFEEANQTSTEPYVDKVADKPLVDALGPKGKVAKKEVNKDFGYETWTLKNGVKVVLKHTDFKADEITMTAKSEGGYSKLSAKDALTAKCITDVMDESGLGNYDATELQKYLSGKNAHVSPYIGETEEGFTGSCDVEGFETMLELVNAYFTQPKFNEDAFKSYVEKQKGMLENASLDPQSVWQDSMRWIMANYSEYRKPMTPAMLDEVNFKNMSKFYKQRFNDPCNFTFYFVGNIDSKKAKPIIEKYLGSLETVERTETFVDLGIRPPKGGVEKDVRKGKDDKCIEIIMFHGDFEYNAQNNTEIDAICKILTTKLLEQIREKESGVYSIGAYPMTSSKPTGRYAVQIFYSCDPAREPELKEKIFDVIKSIQKGEISDDEIAKVIEKKKREHETEVKENKYWRSLVIDLVEGDITPEEAKGEDARINGINKAQMTKAAEKYFKFDSYVKVRLVPEK
ncbi:MAG: insulinase family protein [Bacteroidales bacterium]|jgi:zinc protease|nr:insulinase family protein [Bacteroidales bacterium]